MTRALERPRDVARTAPAVPVPGPHPDSYGRFRSVRLRPVEHKPLILFVALFFAVGIDVLRSITIRGTTLLGIMTLAGALLLLLVILTLVRRRPPVDGAEEALPGPHQSSIPYALWGFLAWLGVETLWHGATVEAVQNAAVYVLFFGGAIVGAHTFSQRSARMFVRAMVQAGAGVATLYIATIALQGRLGADLVYGARSFALTAIVFIAAAVPTPRGSSRRLLQWVPYLVLLAVALSLSRTAGFACLLIVAGRVVRGRRRGRLVRALLITSVFVAVALWAVQNITVLHDRVFGGDAAVTVNGLAINSEGRSVLWRVIRARIGTAPWLGHGPGDASNVIRAFSPRLDQPHNDYLRLVDDFGYLGMALWAAAYLGLMYRCWVRARTAADAEVAAPHYAALLALFGIAIAMITDNVIIYPFAMAPLGALVGASLATPVQRRLRRHQEEQPVAPEPPAAVVSPRFRPAAATSRARAAAKGRSRRPVPVR